MTYIFCAMGIIKKAIHSKIDIFVKFESAINLEIRGQIKKKMDSFYLGHRDHMYAFSSKSGSEPFRALGDLTWNDPFVTYMKMGEILDKAAMRMVSYLSINLQYQTVQEKWKSIPNTSTWCYSTATPKETLTCRQKYTHVCHCLNVWWINMS